MRRVLLLTSAFFIASPGCLPRPATSYEANSQVLSLPSVVVYQDSSGALSYQTSAGRDAGRLLPNRRVQGRSCQRGIQLPILAPLHALMGVSRPMRAGAWLSAGWGDGAYRAAVDDLRRQVPAEAVLYDVRADLDIRMILSIYREQCLVLDAAVLLPEGAQASRERSMP